MLTGRPIERRRAPRTRTDGRMPGKLTVKTTGAELECRSIDVSRLGLGIESEVDLPLETMLVLELGGRSINLRIVACIRPTETTRARRYGLCPEENVDLEAEFSTAGFLLVTPEEVRAVTGEEMRAKRFALDQQLTLQVQTLGTRDPYRLAVENVSRSGLLVAITTSEYLPFRVNTLLDMVIDPDSRAFPKSIDATGKIVRRIEDGVQENVGGKRRTLVRLGIAIIDISPTQDALWQTAIDALEKDVTSGISVTR